MTTHINNQKFNCRLDSKVFSDIIEDSTLTLFLPQQRFNKLHKIFADRLPKDRNTFFKFDWSLKNVTLHISGSNNKIFYREIIDVELSEKERSCIANIIQELESIA